MSDYMAGNQILGVIFAILGGCIINAGMVLQKKVINDLPKEKREDKEFMKSLIKNKVWFLGMFMNIGGGAIFLVIASKEIGPALTPGLSASGMIILLLGSIYIMGEKITKKEIMAIFAMIIGIFFIGLSSFVIPDYIALDGFNPGYILTNVNSEVIDTSLNFITRITLYTVFLLAFWLITKKIGMERKNIIVFSISTGTPFALGNLWIQIMIEGMSQFVININSPESFQTWLILPMIIAISIVTIANIKGLAQVQTNLKLGDASKTVPLQLIIQQIVPIGIFLFVYKMIPLEIQVLSAVSGVTIIILSGFFLSSRQDAINAIG
jgi:drug/metabolite transporter (DMT)-like permease